MYDFLLTHFGRGKIDITTSSSTRRARKEATSTVPHTTANGHTASVLDSSDTVEGGKEAAWVWQVMVLVTVIALVVYITCGCGEAGASGKPVYKAAATSAAAAGEGSPRGPGVGGVRAVSPSALQPLAHLIHSALDSTAAASKSH